MEHSDATKFQLWRCDVIKFKLLETGVTKFKWLQVTAVIVELQVGM